MTEVSSPRRLLPRLAVWLGLALLCAGLPCTGFALDPPKAISQYIREVWTTDNGLPQNTVEAMIQSRDGYLWFGTQEGLVRFDGLRFTVYDRNNCPELLNHNIAQLLEDREGAIWFRTGAPAGVARLKQGKARIYTTRDGLGSLVINGMADDKRGSLWFATINGLARFRNETLKNFTTKDGLASDTLFGLYCDSKGSLWFSTPQGVNQFIPDSSGGSCKTFKLTDTAGINIVSAFLDDSLGNVWISTSRGLDRITNGTRTHFTTKDGLSSNQVRSVFVDRSRTVWIATEAGIDRYEHGAFVSYRKTKDRSYNDIAGFFQEKEGNLWFSVNGKGLGRIGHREGAGGAAYDSIEYLTTRNGLPTSDLRSLLEDKEGSIWIGTNGGGLIRLRDGKFITLTAEDGLSSDLVSAMCETRDGSLWVGSFDRGLSRYKDGAVEIYTTAQGLSFNGVTALFEDRSGTLWIGTNKGLNLLVPGTSPKSLARIAGVRGMSTENISAMTEDRDGSVWIATRSGLFRSSHNAITRYGKRDGLPSELFLDVMFDRTGSLWVASDNGVSQFKDGTFVNYGTKEGLSDPQVFIIHEDSSGTLWCGTSSGGLNRFKGGKFTPITPKDGMFDYASYLILEDDNGNFWSDCNKGIYRVSRNELNDFADGKIDRVHSTAYGTADGMKNRECNGGSQPVGWKTRDGRLCFATVKGVAMIRPSEISLNTIPPPVVIEQVKVDGESLDPQSKAEFPPGKTKFEFHYAGISFLGPEKVVYKYKLEGFDKDWVDAGSRREAYYTNIPHGEYTFKAIAANNDGVWNQTGASTSFTLDPFFYQTSWFYALVIFGFAGVGPGLYTLRVRQLKKRETELLSLVSERTKELVKEKEKTEQAFTAAELARKQAELNREQAVAALQELQEAQKQLVLSEKMASLGQLTAGIAHEIKNPLNFVNNFAVLSSDLTKELKEELNKQRLKLDPANAAAIEELLNDLEQNVTKINDHGKRADSIVKGMLLHSRGKAGERQATDINALLSEYVNLAYHGLRAQDSTFNVKIEGSYDESMEKIDVVPQDISRVFLNIVNNGCYAANEKKKMRQDGFTPTISICTKNLGDRVQVKIRDNGNGVPQSILDKIFNPFFTTKPSGAGTGLGLSLSYDIIVHEHKGDLTVDSKEGEFAEFTITIPKRIS
jgi:ligand-binding sensor domain-containing protein/signal transduction histidine kinase